MVDSEPKLDAVLFDMDGTLMDTEPLWFQSEMEYAAPYGKPWTTEQAEAMVGNQMLVTGRALKEWTGSEDSPEQIVQHLIDWMEQAVSSQPLRWRPGAERLVQELKQAGVPLALVTSSPKVLADAVVSRLPGVFDVVISANDVQNMKPNPEPYLKAAEQLGVSPAGTVILEDSPSGLTSGIAAGGNVIGIPCVVPIPAQERLSRVGSVEDLDLATLRRIAAGSVVDELDEDGEPLTPPSDLPA